MFVTPTPSRCHDDRHPSLFSPSLSALNTSVFYDSFEYSMYWTTPATNGSALTTCRPPHYVTWWHHPHTKHYVARSASLSATVRGVPAASNNSPLHIHSLSDTVMMGARDPRRFTSTYRYIPSKTDPAILMNRPVGAQSKLEPQSTKGESHHAITPALWFT